MVFGLTKVHSSVEMTQSMRQKKTRMKQIKRILMKKPQRKMLTATKKTQKIQKILGKRNHIKTTSKLSQSSSKL